jgi:hypothetical protein
MKLTSEFLLSQRLTQCLPGCAHHWAALGPPLLDARLHPVGANRAQQQRHSWPASTRRAEPPQGIQDADPLHGGVSAWRRWPQDHTHEGVAEGDHRQVFPHAWHGVAMAHIPLHGGLQRRASGRDLPASAGPLGKVGHRVDLCSTQRRHQGHWAGAEPRRPEVVPHLPEPERLWEGRDGLPGEPGWPGLRCQPRHQWVVNASGFEPPGPWEALDGRRPPHTRPDNRPARGDIHELSRAAAEPSVPASWAEPGKMGLSTQAPLGHEYIPWLEGRMPRRPLSQVVGQEGRAHQRQEQARAGREQPEEPGDGKPPPGRGSVGWPHASWRAGVAGLEPPEPATTQRR